MKNLKALLRCYLVFVLLFIIQKPVFLLFQWEQSVAISAREFFQLFYHGFAMDLSVAGYFTAFPAVVFLLSACFENRFTAWVLRIYFALTGLLISLIFVPDLELYSFWGFRIDSTIFNYLSSPKGAAASVSGWVIAGLVVFMLAWTGMEYYLLDRMVVRPFLKSDQKKSRKFLEIALFPVAFGILFILIRGGVTTSTMNVSRVYFSDNMFLNHAAINPCFNLLSSMNRPKNFKDQYHFMDDVESNAIFEKITTYHPSDSIIRVLENDKPNIVFILLESFGKKVLEDETVTPNLNRIAKESIHFNRMYANSFRTDRGIVAALSGYPAQPTMSILKYPDKAMHLESIPASLRKVGYKVSFIHGGDVNFAHIKSYLVSQGITDIIKDTDFPIKDLMNKWGAQDHIVFDRLLKDIHEEKKEPYLKIFLTLSSHEPFDVPFHRLEDPYLNSVAYTDSCLGAFVDSLKQTPAWKNTLLVFVPDHDMKFPSSIQAYEPERFDIFMLWAGGVIKGPREINILGSQTDIAATLLGQLNVDHSSFIFSKNLLDPVCPNYAFYDFPDGFGFLTPDGQVVFDCSGKKVLISEGPRADSLLLMGKAYLQYLYNDIERR